MRSLLLNITAICLLAAIPGSNAGAEIIRSFDPSAGEFPEDVAPDRFGNLYVSITSDRGEIRRLDGQGGASTFFELDPAPLGSFGILALTTDHYGHVYAAVASFHPATHGVWRIDSDGEGFRIPGTEEILMPNDLDFDRRGNLYVTDTIMGAVWRIEPSRPDGRPVELWIQDPALNPEVDLGANGIAIDDREVFVAVTEGASVVRVEIESDGSAGTPEIFAQHPDLLAVDGLDIDHRGRLYGAIVGLHGEGFGRIMRIFPDAAPEPILGPEDGLQFPTNLAFAKRAMGQEQIYVANWDVVAANLGVEPKPAVHTFHLGPPPASAE